ncbi:hypothetical protein H4Q26_017643 [Puccinia striiformis f. sp. tritici PST-130]|nr:hypothetical protein H4Q26_017643 [Puccinia striiformis f. sp. tritici PST-130]
MAFSTFAWHKEDHYTYSINYHHWGDTKTWYGVPGEQDTKLEEAMKSAAPELFEQQPDLMFQLVTLMSPARLRRAGVQTYVCDQRPNEFVITCPRSYHSGFNHGFNLNEAVNFCLPDWLPEGNLCVQHYKALQKMPYSRTTSFCSRYFSTRKDQKLLPHFRQMTEREIADRQAAIAQIPKLSPEIIVEPADLPEDQAMLMRVNSRSVKAGRAVDTSAIEQRTSGRKQSLRFMSRVIRILCNRENLRQRYSKRPVQPCLWPETQLAHASSADNQEDQNEHSINSQFDSTMANESSIDCDENEKTEHGSPTSDAPTKSNGRLGNEPFAGLANENKPTLSGFGSRSASTPRNPVPPAQSDSNKSSLRTSENLKPIMNKCDSLVQHLNSRPPVNADPKATESAGKLYFPKSSHRDPVITPSPSISSQVHRLPVAAQIEGGGSASIVYLISPPRESLLGTRKRESSTPHSHSESGRVNEAQYVS